MVLVISLEEVVITVIIFLNSLLISVITIIMIKMRMLSKDGLQVGKVRMINCVLIALKVHNKSRKKGKVIINLTIWIQG